MTAQRWLRPLSRALAVVAAVLLAELALRAARVGVAPDLLGPWRSPAAWREIRTIDQHGTPWPRPGGSARWALQPGDAEVDYRLDARGFRLSAGGAAATGDACRVVIAGDSNAFGYGVSAADALPEQLALALAHAGVAAVAGNAGVCGSTVRQARRWLDRALLRERPDVLVLVVSPWSLRVDNEPRPGDATVPEKVWNVLDRQLRAASELSSLVDRSHRVLGHALHDAVAWPPSQSVAWELEPLVEDEAAFARRFAAASGEVERIVARASRLSTRTIVVFVPLDVQVSRARNALYREERLPYRAFGFRDRDYTVDERYGRLRALAERLDVPFVDATPALRALAADGYLPEDYHLAPAGHARIAARLAPVVARACAGGGGLPPATGLLADSSVRP